MKQKKSRPISYKWEIIIILWLAYFFNQGDRQIFNAIIPLIKEDLMLSDIQLGLVATVFTVVYGCLVPFGGYLGDFMKHKWIILASVLIFSIGTLFTGMATGLISLLILRGITTGGGEAFYYPAATAMISQHHKKTRALALSIHQTALYTGIIVSGFIAAYIGERFGWRYSFYTFGLGGLLLAICVFFRLKENGNKTETLKQSRAPFLATIKEVVRIRTACLLAVAFGCMVFVNIGYVTWMSTYYHENFNLSLTEAGFTSMFFHFVMAAIGVLVGGLISDKLALKRKTIRLQTEFWGLLIGAPFIFLMCWTSDLYISYAALGAFGFFRGIYDSNLYAALFDVIKPEIRSSSVGLMTAFAFVVGALAPVILGYIKTVYGLSVGLSGLAFFYLLGAVLILIAWKFFFHKEYISNNVI